MDGLSILDEVIIRKLKLYTNLAFLLIKGNTRMWRFRVHEVIKTLYLFRHGYILSRLKETFESFKNPVDERFLNFINFLDQFEISKKRRNINSTFTKLRVDLGKIGASEVLFFCKVIEGVKIARLRKAMIMLKEIRNG